MKTTVQIAFILCLLLFGAAMLRAETHLTATLATDENIKDAFSVPFAEMLLRFDKILPPWADELVEKQERGELKTPKDVWTAYNVFLRAGRYEAVEKLLLLVGEVIRTANPETIYRDNICYRFLKRLTLDPCEKEQRLQIAFWETVDTAWAPNSPSDQMVKLFKDLRWSRDEQLDWYRQRYENALAASKTPEVQRRIKELQAKWEASDGRSGYLLEHELALLNETSNNWLRHYFTALAKGDEERTKERLRREFKQAYDDARNDPENDEKLNYLLQFASALRFVPISDMSWLLVRLDKSSAWQARNMGRCFFSFPFSHPEIVEPFLNRALTETLTDGDCNNFRSEISWRSSMVQPKRSDEYIRALFRAEVMEDLSKLYADTKRNDEAQAMMLRARELRKENGLPEKTELAGAVQTVTGARTVEKEILDEEAESETSPTYWMRRAEYYRGRKEPVEQENALRRALALFDTPEARQKQGQNDYFTVYGELTFFLRQNKRFEHIFELFQEQRKLVKDEAPMIGGIIWKTNFWVREFPHEIRDRYLQALDEIRQPALEWLRTTTTSDDPKYRELFDAQVGLAGTKNVISERIFKPGTLPFWRTLLRYNINLEQDRASIFSTVLSQCMDLREMEDAVKKNPKLDDVILDRLFIDVPENFEGIRLGALNALALEAEKSKSWKLAYAFFEAARDRTTGDGLKNIRHWDMIRCAEKAGDWRNYERLLLESPPTDRHREKECALGLQQVARAAADQGALEDASRLRKRTGNLGFY